MRVCRETFPRQRIESCRRVLASSFANQSGHRLRCHSGPASLSFFDNSSSGLPSRRQQRDAIAYLHATRYLCGYFGDPSDPDNWSIVRKASLSLTNEIHRTMPNEVVWSPMRYLAIVNRVKEECVRHNVTPEQWQALHRP